jgi:hypothetical protein
MKLFGINGKILIFFMHLVHATICTFRVNYLN